MSLGQDEPPYGPGEFTRWTIPFLRTAAARTVVDLGCGPGRSLCYLLEQGFFATGVEPSSAPISLASSAIQRLPTSVGARGRAVVAGFAEFLQSLPPRSIDAVHSAAAYQRLSEDELLDVLDGIHRVLVPGGLHLWVVRNEHHSGKHRLAALAPNFEGLGYTVPLRFFLRYFSRDRSSDRSEDRFDRLELNEVRETRTNSCFYIADRKSGE
jgi:SAM-dependent methyltransferase